MKFRMSPQGMQSANQDIGNIFSMLAQTPLLREQEEMNAALKSAQTYNATSAGDYNAARAGQEQFTLDNRRGAEAEIAANPDMPVEQRLALWAFGKAGPGHVKDFAGGAGEFQTQNFRNQAAENVGNLDMMNRYNTIAQPGQTYEPFAVDGGTGRAYDKATGLGNIIDQALASNYDNKVKAGANKDNAQAGLATARKNNVGKGGSGTDAALMRARARVVDEVYGDDLIAPEDREAEIEARMDLIQKPAKSAEKGTPGTSMESLPKGIPAGSKLIGTSGGKPVYQAPNGKRYIED